MVPVLVVVLYRFSLIFYSYFTYFESYSFESNINGVVGDFKLTKSIEEYDIGIRERIRREYISKGLYQPERHNFSKTQFRLIVHYIVDLILHELDIHFPEVSSDWLLSLACLDPKDLYSDINVNKLVHLVELYPKNFSWIELLIIRTQLKDVHLWCQKRNEVCWDWRFRKSCKKWL